MQLAIFKYQTEDTSNDFTAIEIDGEPWFIAVEACNLLGLTNPTEALKALDDDEKLTSELLRAGQKRNVNLISESGLYSLIFRSKKESAKKFRKWITNEVIPSIRQTGGYEKKPINSPNFVLRFNQNWHKVDMGHFSVISELYVRLYGRFEQIGYQLPDKAFNGKEIRPDVSVGKLFAKYIENEYPHAEQMFKNYEHSFPNGITVDARQYKNLVLPLFIRFIDEEWIPKHAHRYFNERDKKALEFLPKLISPIKNRKTA